MINRAFLGATALSLLLSVPASADPASREKLTEILRDQAVASDPAKLLYAIGSQDLSLTRGELIGALMRSNAPRQARHLLSVGEALESKDGRVKLDRQFANGVQATDGRLLAFGSELTYWVLGRDLVGIRGLHAAKDSTSQLERVRVVRGVVPKPEPEPSAAPVAPSSGAPVAESAAPASSGAPVADSAAPASGDAPAAALPAAEAPATPPLVGSVASGSIGIAGALERALVPGDKGDVVRAMQEQLNRHRPEGTSKIAEDGTFGSETTQAVQAFQRGMQLPETGKIDSATREALEAAQLLSRGDKGAEVVELQRLLNSKRGEAPRVEEDEDFGERTEAAVKAFQRSAGLPESGVADPATLSALRARERAPAPLSRGQEGPGVEALQKQLNEHRRAAGQGEIQEDGTFGAGTEQALKDFQRSKGLRDSGSSDLSTLAELGKTPASGARPSPASSLARGDEGAEVEALQKRLNEHRRAAGESAIEEDGKFGARTQGALEEFQRAKGLGTSGESDEGTRAALARAPAPPAVSRGDEGEAVKALQESLNEHRRAAGQATLAEDGKFGAGTEQALRAFQAQKGLPGSGALDEATSQALSAAPEGVATLKRGDEGAGVRGLQKNLNKHRLAKGQSAIAEDGNFGAGTERALKDFQTDKGIASTGEADPATQSAADAPADETNQAATQASSAELEVLARIVKGECPAAMPWEGKVAVAAVVLNRVRSQRFPNSIRGVAHQPKQFSCYNRNVRQRLYFGRVPDYAWRAARAALAGQDPSRGATFYFNPYLVNPSWKRGMTFIRRIENKSSQRLRRLTGHDFYRP